MGFYHGETTDGEVELRCRDAAARSANRAAEAWDPAGETALISDRNYRNNRGRNSARYPLRQTPSGGPSPVLVILVLDPHLLERRRQLLFVLQAAVLFADAQPEQFQPLIDLRLAGSQSRDDGVVRPCPDGAALRKGVRRPGKAGPYDPARPCQGLAESTMPIDSPAMARPAASVRTR